MDKKLQRMKELSELLKEAAKSYYQEAKEIISNLEYDKLYDELVDLEKETGVVLAGSPTIEVGYEVVSKLPKAEHEVPMLSLDKTKEIASLKSWLGEQKGILSWKLDGITTVLTYKNGKLYSAVTRGNGKVGEVITANAKTFKNIPLQIAYKGELILRGEAIIKYSDFEKINAEIEEEALKYKNPRNLCSGSVRQLNSEITAKRNVHFFAFSLVKASELVLKTGEVNELVFDNEEKNDDLEFEKKEIRENSGLVFGEEKIESLLDFRNSREYERQWLQTMGFHVVEGKLVDKENIEETVQWFSEKVKESDLPSDGLVLTFDDIAYGMSLGKTAKFPKDSIAFKWADEIRETKLLEIEWSASRTGLINPVAIFEPVELEGTTVSRASIHNVSIVEKLQLGIGDTITVYKSNMIIPQIAENLTCSNSVEIPTCCPVCGSVTTIKNENGVKSLYCMNEYCLAKKVKSLTHFVSRDAMNMDGLSEATLEKFIAKGILTGLADIYKLENYKDEIIEMEGFGEKSFQKLIFAIEKSRKTDIVHFLYSLGIPNIGLSNAKLICKEMDYDLEKVRHAKVEQLVEIAGVGEVIARQFVAFFDVEENKKMIDELLEEIQLEKIEIVENEQKFSGLSFVITGSVEHFANRKEVKAVIEQHGGKVTGTVTSKTNYLINNDNMSSSSKNKKAKELGISIITEQEFLEMLE